MIIDKQIKQIFVQHGFKLSNETGDDLKHYVYEAARALIKAVLSYRCALTDDDILGVRDMAMNGDESAQEKWIWFGRMIAILAQQVKPLVFNREHGCLWCKTSIGEYSIHPYAPDNGYVVELDESQEDDDVYETEGKAIEAANIDFRKRVLSCLVNGGGK